ncbi:aminotransferase class I/II-fold pyridoxal phosphate-dependent enzyme [Sphingomonas gei]|uniref:GDP-perosamine synthase n=1 Tax=Sphingomonas gei TaxID=1395960 RepID=A0A4S1X4M0_9SPHN|nr:aminotransferase class I/II-fold pyridoxal phosphate-dependent enzyme [Sphingomonas gei]TGX50385.1 aminotransferase class I/II-fold pyridoxal phosphate-dependent enzyme [Sphingomonas gei]
MSVDIRAVSVTFDMSFRDALAIMDKGGLGLLLLTDPEGRFVRTVTDGDLRRAFLEGHSLADTLARLTRKSSITVKAGASRREALALMNENSINHLPVLEADGTVLDILNRKEIDDQILLSTPHMGDAERGFIEEAFKTNWIAPLGPNVDAFESEMADHVGSAAGAAVSSGTAAIHLALRLLDVGPGDRVFCSTLTFAASVNPILYQGAEPVFIDSETQSWNMCPAALERAFSSAKAEGWLPKAVIIVNLYGQSADMDPLMAICDRYSVPIVEDAAESLGATYKGRASGTFGRIGIYSFNGNKIITTSGGGMLISDDTALVDRARFLATQARDPAPHYQHSQVGYNYRMSNLLAGVGRGQLKVLEARVAARREIFEMYRAGLDDIEAIEWMPEPEWSFSTRWLTTCTISPSIALPLRDVIDRLAAEFIEVRPVWKPMHLQPVFAQYSLFCSGNAPVSDGLFERGLCLPSGSNLTREQVERTIDTLRDVLPNR